MFWVIRVWSFCGDVTSSFEKFKIEFVNTPAYEDLNTQFPIFEIFEMNNGKFEIETVQQAFESWLNNLKPQKRHRFIKDLDKLMSGDYVLVPKEPTPEMERAGMAASAGLGAIKIFKKIMELPGIQNSKKIMDL